jgi:hypothetical protein
MDILTSAAQALWQVVAVGLVLGAGLPALFAFGLRLLYQRPAGVTDGGPTTIARVGAITCFSVVAVATLFGIIVIIFGDQLFG